MKMNGEREQNDFAKVTIGGADGIRTHYLLNANQTLSQLSYSPKRGINYTNKAAQLTSFP
jgi:hypothetical protein